MFIAVAIALVLIAIAISGGYWCYVFWPIVKGRKKMTELDGIRAGMLQVPLAFCSAMFCAGFQWFLMWPICPPLSVVLGFVLLRDYLEFILPIVLTATLIAALLFLLFNKLLRGKKFWAWSLATVTFVIAFFLVGDLQTKRLQAAVLQERNFDCVSLKSFWHSAQIAREEFQDSLHTAARKNGKDYGWSFKTLDFYEIPPNVSQNLKPIC